MNLKPFKLVVFRLVSLCCALLLVISSFRFAVADEPGASVPWRDEFNSPTLDPAWSWQNENPAKWSLTGQYLRIFTSQQATGGENLLLRPVGTQDFAIETRLLFEPFTNFQIAGLVIWQDNANFLQLGRAFCDIPDACLGNGIYFDKIQDGGGVDGNFATPVDNFNEAFLRLERRGEMVKGFFSYEGSTWFEIGTHWIPDDFQVNGVGLTSAQNFYAPQADVPADFDYFELSEGNGFLPEGFHDYDQDDVPNWDCNAGGWAVDPDDRATDLQVEVNVDGAQFFVTASAYLPELELSGQCVGGTCGFKKEMWDLISSYEAHSVTVFAQDNESGEWVRLSNSPKPLTCRSQDIYSFNPKTGETTQLTDVRTANEYYPSWSPNGQKIAHNMAFYDGPYGVYVTDLTSGITSPLAGAEDGGSNPAWSPNGTWIAFDRYYAGDSSLYLVPSEGGEKILMRGDSIYPDWSPNSQVLVFHQPSDGSLRTINTQTGMETLVTPEGAHPAWSPNGKWIAYDAQDSIWKIAVNIIGEPQGEPVRLTGTLAGGWLPTWSADSKTIAYHSGLTRDTNIWTIPSAGGMGTWLTGGIEFGDYDPDFSRSKGILAYSSFTPNGQAARDWHSFFDYSLPAGYWQEGDHILHYEWNEAEGSVERTFEAALDQPLYDDYALLRATGQRGRSGDTCEAIPAIHPDQLTKFHFGWADYDMTFAEVAAEIESLNPRVVWDGGEAVPLQLLEIYPLSQDVDAWQTICSHTYLPTTRTLGVGNFRVEWSPTNPEEITSLRWRNSLNLTNTWSDPGCPGDLEYFGNSFATENAGTPAAFFESLVGFSMEGNWLHQAKAVDISSRSNGCPGSAGIPIRTDYRLFDSYLKANLVGIQRTFSFGDNSYDHLLRPFIPRLYPQDGFTQVIHPDATGTVLVTEDTLGCDLGCLVMDWDGTWLAIHDPDSGLGMIVLHMISPLSTALWIERDGGSFTNASGVVLLPPLLGYGYRGDVTETEYLAFYDPSIWTPSLTLPPDLALHNLTMQDFDHVLFIPVIMR